MTDDRDDPPRRLAERMMNDDRRDLPTHGMRGEPFYPPPPNPGAVQWLDEDDREKIESLMRLEPDLQRMVLRDKSWTLVLETFRKIAVWLTAMGAGLVVLKELSKWLAAK